MPTLRQRMIARRIRRDPLLRPDRGARRATRRPMRTRRPSDARSGGRAGQAVPGRPRGGRGRGGPFPAGGGAPAPRTPRREAALAAVARVRTRGRRTVRGASLDGPTLLLLAELLAAGVRLDRALASLERATDRAPQQAVLHDVRVAVQAGRSLTHALATLHLPSHVRALVAGGERVGRVADGLRAAAELSARLDAVRRRFRQALTYPAVVLAVALIVLVVVSVSIVPQMERTFVDLGGELPTATRAVVAIATVIRSPLTWGAVGLAAASMTALLVRTREGAGGGILVSIATAVVGPFRRRLDTAVATRVVATLLANGATVVDALATAGGSTTHPQVRRSLLELAAVAGSGHPIATTSGAAQLLDPIECEMIAVGEEQGLLAPQWERVADRRIVDLERRLDLLGTLAEPVLVIVVGLIVGGAVTALYLPSIKVLELI
jgi:type II secretory pathway component PulF